MSGKGLSEQQLFDLGLNTVRTPLVTVPGAAIPLPYGGKQRQVQIDVEPDALQARGLSAQDIANALAAQNILTPVGTQKIGSLEYTIQLEQRALGHRRPGAPAGEGRGRRPPSTWATSPTSTTAMRRRPISSTSTAAARC